MATLIEVDGVNEALRVPNDTPLLAAGLGLHVAHLEVDGVRARTARRYRQGHTESTELAYQAPFGGTRDSVAGSHEQDKAAREFCTEWKAVFVESDHAAPSSRACQAYTPRTMAEGSMTELPPSNSEVLQRAVGLSDADREMIRLLVVDGRTPYVEIARQLGEPEKRVKARISDLLDAGVIRISAVATPEALGYGVVAMIGIVCRDRSPSAVADELRMLDLVGYMMLTTGRFDLFVEVYCHDLPHLREVVETQIRSCAGVSSSEMLPYLKLYYQQRLGLNRNAGFQEAVDAELMAELSMDGRQGLNVLSERLGVSETQVRRRLRRLRDSGSMRVQAIINPMSLGFEMMAMGGVSVRGGYPITAVAEELAAIGPVTYVAVCAGRYEILIELVCLNAPELMTVIDDQVRRTEGVESVDLFLYLSLDYKRVLPASVVARRNSK